MQISSCRAHTSGRRAHLIKRCNSLSTYEVGLNFCLTHSTHMCTWMGQENFRILVGLWAKGLLAKFQQSPTKSHRHISSFSSKTLFIYWCSVETVKLNFHSEIYATLDHDLNSGLCFELQIFCETNFTQIIDRYWAAARLSRGWSIYVILQCPFTNLLDITQFSQTATLIVKFI